MGDQRPQDVNWDYWGALDLWPLDAACKLISGDNPNAPTRRGDIENPDIDKGPEWVNVYHQAVSAMKAGNLSVVNGEVTSAEFIAWAQGKGKTLPSWSEWILPQTKPLHDVHITSARPS
jgi:hypothetical protein